MATKIELPIALRDLEKDTESTDAPESVLDIKFPEYCTYCGAPAEVFCSVGITYKPEKEEEDKREPLSIPYCTHHEEVNGRISVVSRIIYLIFGMLALIFTFFVTKFQDSEVWIFVCGFLLYVLAGILIGILTRTAISVFSKSFRHTPLFGGSLGFHPKYNKEEHTLHFSFTNDDYATKFMEANPGTTQKYHYEEDPTALHWIINSIRRNRFALELAVWTVPGLVLFVVLAAAGGDELDAFTLMMPLWGLLVLAFASVWKQQEGILYKVGLTVSTMGLILVVLFLGDVIRTLVVRRLYIGEEPLDNAFLPLPPT